MPAVNCLRQNAGIVQSVIQPDEAAGEAGILPVRIVLVIALRRHRPNHQAERAARGHARIFPNCVPVAFIDKGTNMAFHVRRRERVTLIELLEFGKGESTVTPDAHVIAQSHDARNIGVGHNQGAFVNFEGFNGLAF